MKGKKCFTYHKKRGGSISISLLLIKVSSLNAGTKVILHRKYLTPIMKTNLQWEFRVD